MDQYFLHIKREIWLICEMHAIPFPLEDNAKQAILLFGIDLWQSIINNYIKLYKFTHIIT